MGAGIFWSTAATGALVLFGAWLVARLRDRHRLRVPSPNLDPCAGELAEAEAAYHTELRGAPVIGVPYDAVRSDGAHDAYPHMSQHARDAVVASLNAQLDLPARERTS